MVKFGLVLVACLSVATANVNNWEHFKNFDVIKKNLKPLNDVMKELPWTVSHEVRESDAMIDNVRSAFDKLWITYNDVSLTLEQILAADNRWSSDIVDDLYKLRTSLWHRPNFCEFNIITWEKNSDSLKRINEINRTSISSLKEEYMKNHYYQDSMQKELKAKVKAAYKQLQLCGEDLTPPPMPTYILVVFEIFRYLENSFAHFYAMFLEEDNSIMPDTTTAASTCIENINKYLNTDYITQQFADEQCICDSGPWRGVRIDSSSPKRSTIDPQFNELSIKVMPKSEEKITVNLIAHSQHNSIHTTLPYDLPVIPGLFNIFSWSYFPDTKRIVLNGYPDYPDKELEGMPSELEIEPAPQAIIIGGKPIKRKLCVCSRPEEDSQLQILDITNLFGTVFISVDKYQDHINYQKMESNRTITESKLTIQPLLPYDTSDMVFSTCNDLNLTALWAWRPASEFPINAVPISKDNFEWPIFLCRVRNENAELPWNDGIIGGSGSECRFYNEISGVHKSKEFEFFSYVD